MATIRLWGVKIIALCLDHAYGRELICWNHYQTFTRKKFAENCCYRNIVLTVIWVDPPFNGWSIYHQSASFLPQFPASENFECLSGGKTFWMRKNSWAKKNFRLHSRWLSGIFDHKVFHKLIDVTCWGLVNHAMNKTVVHGVCQGLCCV